MGTKNLWWWEWGSHCYNSDWKLSAFLTESCLLQFWLKVVCWIQTSLFRTGSHCYKLWPKQEEWCCQMNVKKWAMSDEWWVMSYEWWVMSDGNWVTEIEWWKMLTQTGSESLTTLIYGMGRQSWPLSSQSLLLVGYLWPLGGQSCDTLN